MVSKSKLLVANAGDDTFTLVNIKNNYSTKTIYLIPMIEKFFNMSNSNVISFIGPQELILSEKDDFIYSVNSYNNSIFRININRMLIENVIYVGSYPSHVDIYNGYIFVTNSDSNSISVIDEKSFSLIENISVNEKPHDIMIDKDNGKCYVASSNGYSINIIDIKREIEGKIKLKVHPLHLYLNGEYMYILCSKTNSMKNSCICVYSINEDEIVKEVTIKEVIIDMVFVDNKDIIYTTSISDGCLYKIDINMCKIQKKFYIGGMPTNILWDEGELLYIANVQRNIVTVFNYQKEKIIKNINVRNEPNGLLFL